MILHRRSLILGLTSLLAAPAIVRAGSLMPVKAVDPLYDDWRQERRRIIEIISEYRTQVIIFGSAGLLYDGHGKLVRCIPAHEMLEMPELNRSTFDYKGLV